MTVEDNKETLRRTVNIINSGDMSRLDEVYADDVAYRSPEGDSEGVEAFIESMNQGLQALPDLEVTIEELVGEADTVQMVYTWKGTHEGDYAGIPPSNNELELTVSGVFKFRDGEIVEHEDHYDVLTMLRQMGAVSEQVYPGGEEWPVGGNKLSAQ